jgi:hypothetical protein
MLVSQAAQRRIRNWVEDRLGFGAMNSVERGRRMLEEAAELAQACGVKKEQAALIVERVYDKEPGAVFKEVGAALVTVLGVAESYHYDATKCLEAELERIEDLPLQSTVDRQMKNLFEGIGEAPLLEQKK